LIHTSIPAADSADTGAPWWRNPLLKLWPALAIIAVDQITKVLIQRTIEPGTSVRILGDLVIFTHQLNPAGAMSIRLGPPAFYLVVTGVVAAFLAYTLIKNPLPAATRWALTLVLAGAVGNMIDRLRLGAVIDFIDCEFFDFSLPAIHWGPIQVPGEMMTRWPVFNVADASVTTGILLLIVATLWIDRRHGDSKSPDNG
jgi:signal peptidase II